MRTIETESTTIRIPKYMQKEIKAKAVCNSMTIAEYIGELLKIAEKNAAFEVLKSKIRETSLEDMESYRLETVQWEEIQNDKS